MKVPEKTEPTEQEQTDPETAHREHLDSLVRAIEEAFSEMGLKCEETYDRAGTYAVTVPFSVKPSTQTKPSSEPKKPEDMPEFQDALSQALIRDWRKDFPEWSDERIIETLRAW